MKRSQLLLACSAAILVGLLVLYGARYRRAPSNALDSNPVLYDLALLEPNKLLAKVGNVELRSEDLRAALQADFHGDLSHAGLTPEDLASKVGGALDTLIEDELLARAGRLQGLKTNLQGREGRKDLAQQLLTQHLAKLPPVDEAALRNFYKNHGEKFVIAERVEVRELFLPLQGRPDKRSKDKSYVLGQELADRIRKGEEHGSLAAQYSPESELVRAQVHEF
ncbi:MAG TPA: hypothetical protein VHP35_11150, partial [Terriglobia bacterium]|nr:hypothetical protein [Terriglobia bacterium]